MNDLIEYNEPLDQLMDRFSVTRKGNIGCDDTIIVQYDYHRQLKDIQGYFAKRRRSQSSSTIPPFIFIECFMDLNNYNDGMKWARIVYECLEGNNKPSSRRRFGECLVLHWEGDSGNEKIGMH